ncbi:acyltransferase family protein [Azohydromonas caseinilytica]|uniref:Acyltransferase n=1 Tax=Azohydromonas caseinilytica TaxID=2728836 RepID=A0A848FHK8_9BURK|nr:acyltransferase [Azohydromonas caseinilytica]NML17769.1 acyltransferase [Azohydromonas caseinilytica]
MQRLSHLDGLRGIAALLVVYQHLVEYAGGMAPVGSWVAAHLAQLLTVIDLGKAGVIAFFAISGFVVPFSFGTQALPRLGFTLSRLFRLYPAYWLSLGVTALLLPALGVASFNASQLVANLSMVQLLLGHEDVLSVYWTLLVELVFYASCLVVFSLGRLRSPAWCAGMVCALLAVALVGSVLRARGYALAPVGVPLYLAIMWFSAGLRLWLLEKLPGAGHCCLLVLPLLLVLFPVAWSTAYDDHSHRESVLAVITAFYAGLALFFWCVLRRRFASPLLVRLGALSYALYLFHPLALDLAQTAALRWSPSWPWSVVTLAALTLALSFLAAAVVQRWLEMPGIAAGKRLMSRIAAWHATRRAGEASYAGRQANTEGRP